MYSGNNTYRNRNQPGQSKSSALSRNRINVANNNAQTVPSVSSSTVPMQQQTAVEGDVDWGDESDEEFLHLASQIEGEAEAVLDVARKPSPSATATIQNRTFMRHNSDERPSTTPAENFELRRKFIADKDQNRNPLDNIGNSVIGRTERDWQALLAQIKSKDEEIAKRKSEQYSLQGEASMLRSEKAKLVEEQQEAIKKRLLVHNDITSQTKEYKKEIHRLTLQIKLMESEKTSASFNTPKTRRRGDTSLNSSNVSSTSGSPNASVFEESTCNQVLPSIALAKNTLEKGIQTAALPMPIPVTSVTSPIITSSTAAVIVADIQNEDYDWNTPSRKLFQAMFAAIDKMVELRYELILPKLESISKRAPQEIMRRLVRKVEIKPAFPDVVDSMFQWGIDKERCEFRKQQGIIDPQPPKLPSQCKPGIHFHEIKLTIETTFLYHGVWETLREVREWLQKILQSLDGADRFRIYEINTLVNFWKLLLWASELWRCVMFEEEDTEYVENRKSVWKKELEGWCGLVLKCDWRDYFVLELEKEIRKLTLNILQDIVTAGYFEHKKNRYVIMYRVMKEALTVEAFRDIRSVQRILKILTWSISDKEILKYLCCKTNDGNCLGRLIGENVAILCRQEKDPVAVTSLYLDYVYLLETLMREVPVGYHISKFARNSSEDIEDNSRNRENQDRVDPSAGNLGLGDLSDFEVASQFACPERYYSKPVVEPMDVGEVGDDDALSDGLSCWLDPIKYEDPFGKKKYCQCRKVLMGTSISVLKIIFNIWKQKHLEYERQTEEQEASEVDEISHLELEIRKSDPTSGNIAMQEENTKRLKFLKEKHSGIRKLVPIAREKIESSIPDKEWNWDDVLQYEKDIFQKTNVPHWLTELGKQKDIIDLALSKGLVMMSFLQSKSENLAAAIGTDKYKIYMTLIPLLRLHINQINFNPVDRDILMVMTPECEEDHMGSSMITEDLQIPTSSRNLSIGFPMPLNSLEDFYLDDINPIKTDGHLDTGHRTSAKLSQKDVFSLDSCIANQFQDFLPRMAPT